MFDIEIQKEQEINKMVSVLKQIDVLVIELMTHDANLLLMRKKRADQESECQKTG